MVAKIALEEHFIPAQLEQLVTNPGWAPEAWRSVLDNLIDTERRLEEMDRLGIDMAVLSLASHGIQDVLNLNEAVRMAAMANDGLARIIARHPDRYTGFAALPMQDPGAAAAELERAVRSLGMKGALVNGYSSVGTLDHARYYDDPEYWPFWERVEALDVPFYLHPRNPLPDQRRIYDGCPQLLGPTWAFAVETGTHALRLILSGLFDRFPNLQIVLGHMGELLPFAIRRLEQRLQRRADNKLQRPASAYLHDNFWITTSGNNHTPSLIAILLELGSDRLMFGSDYPFEHMRDGAQWLDSVAISDIDREKIGHLNARRLLRL